MSIRTTVTLDEDIVARLRESSVKLGISYRKLINDTLRRGLAVPQAEDSHPLDNLPTFAMGEPKFPIDNVGELLDYLEGEDRRW